MILIRLSFKQFLFVFNYPFDYFETKSPLDYNWRQFWNYYYYSSVVYTVTAAVYIDTVYVGICIQRTVHRILTLYPPEPLDNYFDFTTAAHWNSSHLTRSRNGLNYGF